MSRIAPCGQWCWSIFAKYFRIKCSRNHFDWRRIDSDRVGHSLSTERLCVGETTSACRRNDLEVVGKSTCRRNDRHSFNLVQTHKPIFFFFAIAVPNLFLAPFLSFFLALLLSLPRPFAFHIFSGYRKKFDVNSGLTLEIGPWSIIVIRGHLTTIIFPSKVITLFPNLLRHNARGIQKRLLGR